MNKRVRETARHRQPHAQGSSPAQTSRSKRRWFSGLGSLAVLAAAGIFYFTLSTSPPAQASDITVYKSPTCGCCTKWIEHLQENGFTVQVEQRRNMQPIKAEFGVQPRLQSCHTAVTEGYVIEGHVPASDIKRLLLEKPDIKGLAVPGMPMGSPGMEGPRKDAYSVLAVDKQGRSSEFSRH